MITIKVLIVDDHPIFLEGLKNLLISQDFEVIGTANNGEEAILLAEKLKPEVIIMDVNMSGISGIEATRQITTKFPNIKIIMLTSFEEDESLFKAIKAGASGYLLKNLDSNYLAKKLNDLKEGEKPFSPALLDQILDKVKTIDNNFKTDTKDLLSEQQIDIIKFIIQGLTYAEIGEKLFISERTVKYHIKKIKEITGTNNKNEIISYGVKNKLL